MGIVSLMYHRFNENQYPSTNIKIAIFKKQIEQITGEGIRIIDSGFAVANQTKNILKAQKLDRIKNTEPTYEFLSNKNTTIIKTILKEYKNVTVATTNF